MALRVPHRYQDRCDMRHKPVEYYNFGPFNGLTWKLEGRHVDTPRNQPRCTNQYPAGNCQEIIWYHTVLLQGVAKVLVIRIHIPCRTSGQDFVPKVSNTDMQMVCEQYRTMIIDHG